MPPNYFSTHHLTQTAFTRLHSEEGCSRKNNLSDVIVSIYDLCFLFFCTHILFLFGPAAQPTDPALETMTPVCCWGSLRESRTRGQPTFFPTGRDTPGSGTAVISEYNVMSLLSNSPPHNLLALTLCSPGWNQSIFSKLSLVLPSHSWYHFFHHKLSYVWLKSTV